VSTPPAPGGANQDREDPMNGSVSAILIVVTVLLTATVVLAMVIL
jgi:hypothetical protein